MSAGRVGGFTLALLYGIRSNPCVDALIIVLLLFEVHGSPWPTSVTDSWVLHVSWPVLIYSWTYSIETR